MMTMGTSCKWWPWRNYKTRTSLQIHIGLGYKHVSYLNRIVLYSRHNWGSYYSHGLTSVTTRGSNIVHYNVWGEITYPIQTSTCGIDTCFHPTLHWICDYLSMLGLKLICVIKRASRPHVGRNYADVASKGPISTLSGLLCVLVRGQYWNLWVSWNLWVMTYVQSKHEW